MPINPYSIARLPRIEFGAGNIAMLPDLVHRFGRRIALVTGARSFQESPHWKPLQAALGAKGVSWELIIVADEPSPARVDEAVGGLHGTGIEAVVGIGGGSVLDAGKAIAALVPSGDSVMNYLEGVGPQLPYQGPAAPYIGVPTTAGTGSEATKNAVLTVRGEEGFKRSFRHEALVPAYALLDPDLLATCPPPQIAANAMDALTQLIESYLSLRANPMTDALALAAIDAVRRGLFAWYEGGEGAADGRALMAHASLTSGICLAQTGFGSVHGLASPLGAFFPIPHGVACGTLLAAATRVNIDALREREPDNPVREKYARVGNILTGRSHKNPRNARESLVLALKEWTERLNLPGLGPYGVQAADIPRIVAHSRGSSMKTNPVVLTDEEIGSIVGQRL
jgi:alcohol dehydrogenase